MTMWHVKKMVLEYKVPKPGEIPPYHIGRTPDQDMPGHGLFQLATFKAGTMDNVGKGYNVYQGWNMPTNYFGAAARSQILNKVACQDTPGRPCVHALVASQCPQMLSGNNCVWPNPTPKYQTRLYP